MKLQPLEFITHKEFYLLTIYNKCVEKASLKSNNQSINQVDQSGNQQTNQINKSVNKSIDQLTNK